MPIKQVINLHGKNAPNIGDNWSAPYHYFRFANARTADINDLSTFIDDASSEDAFIIGGGGQLAHHVERDRQLIRLANSPAVSICWGVGVNLHTRPFKIGDLIPWVQYLIFTKLRRFGRIGPGATREKNVIPAYLSKFDLYGIRDYLSGFEAYWVPCASCMHKSFDNRFELKRKIGIFEHRGVPIPLKRCGAAESDRLSNDVDSIEEVIEFIGSSEILLTSSYHGVYWGTLLGKKVIVYRPFSTKFLYCRHRSKIYSGDFERDISTCPAYPDALAQCREANLTFYRTVLERLDASSGDLSENATL